MPFLENMGIAPSFTILTGTVEQTFDLVGLIGLVGILGSEGRSQPIFTGIILIGIALLLWTIAKHKYNIFFGTAGGEKQALSSADANYVNRVAKAINDALIGRG
jgi:Family of unknown function (DUF6232)